MTKSNSIPIWSVFKFAASSFGGSLFVRENVHKKSIFDLFNLYAEKSFFRKMGLQKIF